MAFLEALLTWASVPYVVSIGVAVLFAVLQATGLLGLLAGGDDHDADHDGAADGDADGDTDSDADDADGDHDHDAQGFSVLADLGVGKVPLSILWQTFAFAFGFAGVAANVFYLSYARALPLWTLAVSLPVALVFGYLVTRQVGRAVARVVADPAQEATSRAGLVGHTGVVISSKVDAEFGEVRIRDRSGHVVRVACRVRVDDSVVPERAEVVVVDYDREKGWLYVAPLESDERARRRG
jgi:membrane protein implicated in regulation of membrane protease activity